MMVWSLGGPLEPQKSLKCDAHSAAPLAAHKSGRYASAEMRVVRRHSGPWLPWLLFPKEKNRRDTIQLNGAIGNWTKHHNAINDTVSETPVD
jgi:hypothetical protein